MDINDKFAPDHETDQPVMVHKECGFEGRVPVQQFFREPGRESEGIVCVNCGKTGMVRKRFDGLSFLDR